ncbi:MAG: hypothetical protein AAFP76_16040 [Bacteroidota bacterium]
MDTNIDNFKIESHKLPGGPFSEIEYTTPFVTFHSWPEGLRTHFKVDIVAQIPHEVTPTVLRPIITEDPIYTPQGPEKMQKVVIQFPYKDRYGAPNIYFFTLTYTIDTPHSLEDHKIYAQYQTVEGSQPGDPFPDPELERGTVTTSGVPDP